MADLKSPAKLAGAFSLFVKALAEADVKRT
jgi:hypothetical protein